MTIQITFTDEVEHLLVALQGGVWKTQEGVNVLHTISERAREEGHKRVLIDRRNLARPESEYARFEAGRTTAKLFPPPYRIAVVYPEEQLNRFGEDVAVNRGAAAAVFSDLNEARRWLLAELSA